MGKPFTETQTLATDSLGDAQQQDILLARIIVERWRRREPKGLEVLDKTLAGQMVRL